jgi:signal transduction histidine kinase
MTAEGGESVTIGYAMARRACDVCRRMFDVCRRVFEALLRVGEPDTGDPALSMYLRRMNAFTLIVGTLVLGIALRRYLEGAVIAASIEASLVCVMHVPRLLVLRKPTMRKLGFAAHASIAAGMCIIIGTAMVLGQLRSPSLLYLGLLPLAGGYAGSAFGGTRGALWWGLAACAGVALVGLTQLIVSIPPEVQPTDADAMVTLLVVLLSTTGFAHTARRGNDQYLRDLQDREDRIQKQAAELAIARDAALEASRVKSTFLANTSHEIRTPMNVIIGMTEMALDAELDTTTRDYLQRVRAAALGLLGIINDILDLSKIEAGKMMVEVGPFDLRNTVGEVATLLTPSAASKGLALRCRIDAAVPANVRGDAGRLRQVLTNLLNNAIKFTERGEVALEVRRARATGSRAEILFAVRDTGIGIPPERQAAVFESFTQVDDGTTRKFGGTGLGLTISRQLVELMGSEIRLESTVGEGSTFSFVLDFAADAAESSAHAAPAAA